MTILLPALAIALAASCVWLTVRFINRRERWAKWTLAFAVGLPVLYILSFGPACWGTSRIKMGAGAVSVAYRPLMQLLIPDGNQASPIAKQILRFAHREAKEGWSWHIYEVGLPNPNGEVTFEYRYDWHKWW